jgi:hypothetical protein
MHPRQAEILGAATDLMEKTAAKGDKPGGAAVLWKYTDPDGMDFYLEEKRTTIKSPFSGKSFAAKPKKHTPAQVGQEMKQDAKAPKTAAEDVDFWKV